MNNPQILLPLLMVVLLLPSCADRTREEVSQALPETVQESEPEPAPEAVPEGEEVAVLVTSAGKIVFRFYEEDAPQTVAQFKRLVTGYFYDGTTFHRVVPGMLIQGGDPLSRDNNPYNDGTGKADRLVPAEFSERPFRKGTVGLARGPDPDSGSCQFFICLNRMRQWDGQYTAFAEVIGGLAAAEEISRAQTNPKAVQQVRERPIREQVIKTIRLERRRL